MNPNKRSLAGAVMLACLGTGIAHAQTSPWYLGLSQSFGTDSNLLRLSDGAVAPSGFSQSDRFSSTALVGGLDQPVGRQRLSGSLTLRDTRYSRNSIYDNQGWALGIGLDWQTVERFSGSVNVNSSRQLSSFGLQELGSLTRKNLETTNGIDTVTRLGIAGPWALELGLGTLKVDNSLDQDNLRSRNYAQDSGSLGLRWRPSALLGLTVSARSTKGRYPEFQRLADGSFQADRFERRDLSASADWRVSGASAVDLRLSQGKTVYDLAQARNFSGLTGSLGWRWVATAKLSVSARLARDTGQDSYAVTVFDPQLGFVPGTVDYSRAQTSTRLRADWSPTAKIGVNLGVSTVERDLVRTLPSTAFGGGQASGKERSTQWQLGARWVPQRWLQLGCEFSVERRQGSGQLGSDLDARRSNCFGQVTPQ